MNRAAVVIGTDPALIANFTHAICIICAYQDTDGIECPLISEDEEQFKIDFQRGGLVCLAFEENKNGF